MNATELPECVLAMGCLCAGHARGVPASEPCDTNEGGDDGDDCSWIDPRLLTHAALVAALEAIVKQPIGHTAADAGRDLGACVRIARNALSRAKVV